MRFRRSARSAVLSLAAVVLPLAGCAGDNPLQPEPPTTETLTADASAGWAFVELGIPASGVSVSDPSTSAAWDIAFNATRVMLNGGTDGPAGVVGYCVCQNRDATNEQVLAMTPDSELAKFEAVRAEQIPAAADPAWTSEVFEANRWYRYNLTGNHQISPTFEVYLIRRGREVYKVQLIGYYGPAGEPRRVSMRYSKLAG